MSDMQKHQGHLNTFEIIKKKYEKEPEFKLSILKWVYHCNESSGNCSFCQEEKYFIISFPDSNNLLNKKSELVGECR